MKILAYIVVVAVLSQILSAQNLDYALIKKGEPSSNTMLLIGGIQGDEPGGFLAASIVATDYNITKGSLWVVPNLNFPSIIERSRGTKGDMNRKFAHVDRDDPDYESVVKIKDVIADPSVSLILNLHDGSGYYRESYVNKDENPQKWGSSCIIDQETLAGAKYPELAVLAAHARDAINARLLDPKHAYRVKNTRTAEGDKEMLKSLTYYAVTRQKSAFANEASKNLNAQQRVYYHLIAIEEYMRAAGIEFSRPFELDVPSVKKAIEKEIRVSFFDDAFALDVHDLRPSLKFVPFKKGELKYDSPNPLIAVIKEPDGFKVQYGNRFVTRISPQFFEFAPPFKELTVIADGKNLSLKSGDKIVVSREFSVQKRSGARINVIGYNAKGDEAGEKISLKSLQKQYSMDKGGRVYRVEAYESGEGKERYAGMFLVEFK